VLALGWPALGFGAGRTLVALYFLYGLLPIFETGESPPYQPGALATMEAARGMGSETAGNACGAWAPARPA